MPWQLIIGIVVGLIIGILVGLSFRKTIAYSEYIDREYRRGDGEEMP